MQWSQILQETAVVLAETKILSVVKSYRDQVFLPYETICEGKLVCKPVFPDHQVLKIFLLDFRSLIAIITMSSMTQKPEN